MDASSAKSPVSIVGAEGNLREFIKKAIDELNIGATSETDYEVIRR
ncbi:MAG: hypothetical protein KKI07_00670 [Euryarchaeota archaeon]|nr:hypothetical protein [Euryarchaeota archaeon]